MSPKQRQSNKKACVTVKPRSSFQTIWLEFQNCGAAEQYYSNIKQKKKEVIPAFL